MSMIDSTMWVIILVAAISFFLWPIALAFAPKGYVPDKKLTPKDYMGEMYIDVGEVIK